MNKEDFEFFMGIKRRLDYAPNRQIRLVMIIACLVITRHIRQCVFNELMKLDDFELLADELLFKSEEFNRKDKEIDLTLM